MNVSELVERLKLKDQTAEIEFIVVTTDGLLVTANVGKQAKPMVKFLKNFKD